MMLGVGKLIIVIMLCLLFFVIGLLVYEVRCIYDEDKAFHQWLKELDDEDFTDGY